MVCGVYKITCIKNNKFYIGSAKNIGYRWRKHKETLNRNCHHNKYLQRCWNKYGKDAFVWDTIEIVDVDKLIVCEQQWLDKTKCYLCKIGFNTCRVAYSSLGRPASDKCIEASSKKWIMITPQREEMVISNLAKFCRDNKLNRETLKAVAAGRGNSWKGWQCRPFELTYEQWQKLRIACQIKSGKIKCWVVTDLNGFSKSIVNLRSFCKENGLTSNSMRKVALGIYSQHKGWKCKYA